MTAVIPEEFANQLFTAATEADVVDWTRAIDRLVGGTVWLPLGGIENNVHTVEVASDPALALVERPTNSIDALLDLRAREQNSTAATPHEAAVRWWGVPEGGLAAMSGDRESERQRRELADMIRISMVESGDGERPTIVIQDQGTGQHPDDFDRTLLSLLASNKKGATHQMGVYNAGGAASFKFAKAGIVVSRLAPTLLAGRNDAVGATVVRYNPLDPDRFKSGVYEYLAAADRSILRLAIAELPNLPYGTYVKLIEYTLPKYARAAYEPKRSLWHLFHAALPDPALPFRIVETRAERFTGVRNVEERRVVSGLLHLLGRPGVAAHSDERQLNLDPSIGTVVLRYFVLNDSSDPDAYTTPDQGLTITLNGQRQITKDRQWLRRQLELYYLYKRLVVVVDATGLTNAAKRQVFSSTRETAVDTPVTKEILDRVVNDLIQDEDLDDLEEAAKQRALQDATDTTTDRIRRRLGTQIAAMLKGAGGGARGGETRRPAGRRKEPRVPRVHDDSLLLEVPDKLQFITNPIRIERGRTTSFSLAINAKNGFIPRHASGLQTVIGPELSSSVRIVSRGSLLGGRVRFVLDADNAAPLLSGQIRVALVVPELGILLTDEATLQVVEREQRTTPGPQGGQPDIRVLWVRRDKWGDFEPPWTGETVGRCDIYREDPARPDDVTKVEWLLNEAFTPFEQVIGQRRFTEDQMKTFRDGYSYPVLFGLFRQRLDLEAKGNAADQEGGTPPIPEEYARREQARMARAVLMAMEPEITLAEADPT